MAVWSSLTSAAWRTADHLWAVLTGFGLLFFYLALLSRCKVVTGAPQPLLTEGWSVLDLYGPGTAVQLSSLLSPQGAGIQQAALANASNDQPAELAFSQRSTSRTREKHWGATHATALHHAVQPRPQTSASISMTSMGVDRWGDAWMVRPIHC